jgi:hypothetical protein
LVPAVGLPKSGHRADKKGIDAVPLMKSDIGDADAVADGDAVIRITLREFPAPSDATPWESIQGFRRDKAARERFWSLKRWINKTDKAGDALR